MVREGCDWLQAWRKYKTQCCCWMAVSTTVKTALLELCELCEVPWTEEKAVAKIRAFRADGRDCDGDISARELANMMGPLFNTLFLSPYAMDNMAEVAKTIYMETLPQNTRNLLQGDGEFETIRVPTWCN